MEEQTLLVISSNRHPVYLCVVESHGVCHLLWKPSQVSTVGGCKLRRSILGILLLVLLYVLLCSYEHSFETRSFGAQTALELLIFCFRLSDHKMFPVLCPFPLC